MFSLTEAIEALDGHTEFAVKEHSNGLVTLDYIICFPGSFSASEEEIARHGLEKANRHAWLRRNFRGITYNKNTQELLSLPLHKFYNLDQVEETRYDKLKGCTATIYEKVDGSLVHLYIHNGNLIASTCRSPESPQSAQALALIDKNLKLKLPILENIYDGYTPIFEYVAPTNRIVVRYDQPRLIYLISRHRETGEYKFDDRFDDRVPSFSFPFSDVHSHLDKTDFEGYVCHLDNGMIVKVKTPWYMERHHIVDFMMRPKYKLHEIVYQGAMDDLIALAIDEEYKQLFTEVYQEAQSDLLKEKNRIEALGESIFAQFKDIADPVLRKKELALYCQEHHLLDFHLLMAIFSGREGQLVKYIQRRLLDGYAIKYNEPPMLATPRGIGVAGE